jgi:hypothetical protein
MDAGNRKQGLCVLRSPDCQSRGIESKRVKVERGARGRITGKAKAERSRSSGSKKRRRKIVSLGEEMTRKRQKEIKK